MSFPSPAFVRTLVALVMVVAAGGRALAAPSLGAVMAHSRDDIPGGFSSLTGNDGTVDVTLPFSVTIDGVSYGTVTISTNGWMEFGGNSAGNSDPTNDCLPSAAHTRPLLAFYWDDMRTINTAIRYGTVGTSPGRVFIVDADIENNFGGNHDVTLQVQIHEGSNLISVKYDDTDSEAVGQTATIGFQGAGGSGATARSVTCNGRVLDDNTLVDGWSIDLGVSGWALSGYPLSSSDDISGFTTLSGNDATANVTIPFPVVVDGTSYTTATISTNGWIELGGNTSGNSDPTNDCLPSSAHTNPLLAFFWDDLRTINTAIRYGTVGTSPGRTFIVDFDLENNNANNHDITGQVQIHEQSGLVTVKYVADQNEANGQGATVGFQGAGGASAIAHSLGCNAKILDDNQFDEGWSIDLGSSRSSALHGVIAHSRDDLPGGFQTLSGNDAVATATVPFTVTIDGVGYTTVALSTNGWLEFGGNTAGNSHPANTCLPNASHTNPFLAAYWDDMRTVGAAIRYGTVGTAGGRVFIADFVTENNFGANHDLFMQVQVHEGSNAITVKYTDSEAESNGQTATIGWQGTGGASAQVRSIGCNAKVLDDNFTRGEGWSIAQVIVCGDSIVGAGEACDLGAANGAATSCCTATCTLRTAGSDCRPSAGPCDVAETCTGGSPTCPANGFASSATVCRGSSGVCDVAENCTGSAAACPGDAFASGNTCRTGSGDLCDPDEVCDGGGAACPADVIAPASTVCRASAGVCDVAENCTGVAGQTCPGDGFVASGTECRASAGICDVAESCTGSAAACPADAFASGNGCRSGSGDLCDPDETCDGSGAACPPDVVASASTECRGAAGVCDVAESCTGMAGQVCPGDAFASASTECRASAGICDVAESCTGSGTACPADGFDSGTTCRTGSGDLCDPDETCDGSGADCPADAVADTSTECRAAAGDCDVAESCPGVAGQACPADSVAGAFVVCRTGSGDACDPDETCDGSGVDCPADVVATAGTECRTAAGDCDVAESCTGVAGVTCPTDSVSGAFVPCRPAAGACDLAENCDGTNVACPADIKSTAPCRAAAGICDVAESCNGVGDDCPADGFAPASTVCRAAAGLCDVAEHCTGSGAACPADVGSPDGDGDGACDAIDVCPVNPDPLQVDTDDDGRGDECDPCTQTTPSFADKHKVTLTKIGPPTGDDKLKIQGRCSAFTQTPAIDPVANGVRVLLEDAIGNVVLDEVIPGGAYSNVTKSGWKAKTLPDGISADYKNNGSQVALQNGITGIKFVVRTAQGLGKFKVKGKTGTYPVAVGNEPVKATIVIDPPFAKTGQCCEAIWPATFPAKPSCVFKSNGTKLQCK